MNNELLEIPILYLSKHIIENKKAYYNGLREVTEENKWSEWILYILDAIEHTALFTEELLHIIFRQPYLKRKFLEEAGLVKKKTAGTYLARLEELGLLRSIIVGKEKLFINYKLFDILKKSNF